MKHIADVSFKNNKFVLSGILNFSTVMKVYNSCIENLSKYSASEFDFSQVESCNSAGLALVIELKKYGRQVNKAVSISHLPEDLKSLAEVSGLSHLI